jgi:hypothetical protein
MRVGGIDPGKRGAVAVIENGIIIDKQLLVNVTPPDYFAKMNVDGILIEKAQSMGKESAKAMFTYGREYGFLVGTLWGKFSLQFVQPSVWTAHYQKQTPIAYNNPKEMALYAAKHLWPSEDWREGPRCRVPHDGLVDACLIAFYYYLHKKKA